jgi:dienelactone hydrolase
MLLSIWSAAPAAATVTDRSRQTTPYEYENWDCGYPIDVVGVAYDQMQLRVDSRTGNTYFTDNYAWSETWTAAHGGVFKVSGNGVFKDVKAQHVDGSIWAFTQHNTGQPIVISDASGKVLSRDRGNFTETFTVDVENGVLVDYTAKIAAPHPMIGGDLCLVVRPITGNDGYTRLTAHPIGSTTFPMGFYDYLPPSYQGTGTPSPLLIALNGYGENGDGTPAGLPLLLQQGIPRFINVGAWPADRTLVVLALQHVEQPGFNAPQCDGVDWGGSCIMFAQDAQGDTQPAPCTRADEVHDFITYALAHYNVDPHRVYVTGLSCGGYGAWEYLAKYGNQQIAAAVPASGEGRPAWASAGCGLTSVPIWAFAGAQDDVVNPDGSIVTMHNVQACGGPANRAQLSVYDDFGHDAWNPAYDGQEGDDIYSWMLGFTNP